MNPTSKERSPVVDLSAIDSTLTAAEDCLSVVCSKQGFKLRACVPVQQTDDDLVISEGVMAGRKALAALEAASAEVARLRAERDKLRDCLTAIGVSEDRLNDGVYTPYVELAIELADAKKAQPVGLQKVRALIEDRLRKCALVDIGNFGNVPAVLSAILREISEVEREG